MVQGGGLLKVADGGFESARVSSCIGNTSPMVRIVGWPIPLADGVEPDTLMEVVVGLLSQSSPAISFCCQ